MPWTPTPPQTGAFALAQEPLQDFQWFEAIATWDTLLPVTTWNQRFVPFTQEASVTGVWTPEAPL